MEREKIKEDGSSSSDDDDARAPTKLNVNGRVPRALYTMRAQQYSLIYKSTFTIFRLPFSSPPPADIRNSTRGTEVQSCDRPTFSHLKIYKIVYIYTRKVRAERPRSKGNWNLCVLIRARKERERGRELYSVTRVFMGNFQGVESAYFTIIPRRISVFFFFFIPWSRIFFTLFFFIRA